MFFKSRGNKQNLQKIKRVGLFVALINIIGGIFYFLQPKKVRHFIKKERTEVKELTSGKEDLKRFIADSKSLLNDLFIPSEGNNHKPRALRPKSLASYAIIAVVIKLSVTGFLFFTYPNPAELAAIVSEKMVSLINDSRVEAGVEPLMVNTILIDSAQAKGEDMMGRQYFAHDTPEGKRPWQWIDRSQYDYVFAGENLAIDFKTAEAVHEALMKSPTHRKNILNPRYKELGIAVVNGEFDDRDTILLVEFFGTQRKDFSTLAANQPAQPAATAPTQPVQTTPSQPVTTSPEPTSAEPQPAAPSVVTEPTPSAPIPTSAEPATVAGQAVVDLTPDTPLEAGVANEGVIVITSDHQVRRSVVDFVIEYSNIFFVAFLIFILLSLVLNIFIHIRVQHSSVIVQTIAVAALITAMILVKFHFVEQIAPHILIL